MNQMWKPQGAEPPLPPGDYALDLYQRGRQAWDERIGDAVTREKRWRLLAYLLLPVLAVSSLGNVIQGMQGKTQVVHVVHDSLGSVITMSAATGQSGEPSQVQAAAALREWITRVRSVYADAGLLKTNITDAYKLVSTGSMANALLDKFYLDRDPFQRARSEIDYVVDAAALPPSSSAGPHGERTWLLQWTEELRSRDGTVTGRQAWQASVTWFWTSPQNVPEALANPDGIHITSLSWTMR